MPEILKPTYDEVRERIRDFWGGFEEKNFKIPILFLPMFLKL